MNDDILHDLTSIARPGEQMWIDTVLYDDFGRVLQVRDPQARVWRLPETTVNWPDQRAVLAAAATSLAELIDWTPDVGSGEPIHWTIDSGSLRVAVVFRITNARARRYSSSPQKRWAPWDTLRDRSLGAKLQRLSD